MTKDMALYLCGQLAAMGLIKTNNATVQSYVTSQLDYFLESQKLELTRKG